MSDLINIENYTPEQLQLLQTKIIAKQMNQIEQGLLKLAGQLENHEAKFEIVEEKQKKAIEIAANSLRVQNGRYEFVNQGDFGRFFTISLSSQEIGKIFRIVGLAQPSRKGSIVPYRKYMGKYCQVIANSKYSTTQWHYENCMEKIDNWLKENNFYEDFYSIQNEKEMKIFINTLFDKYIN